MYSKCGCLQEARQLFDKIRKQGNANVITWSAMIAAYTQQDQAEDAINLFHEMNQESIIPDDRTYSSILTACASLVNLKLGKEIVDEISKRNIKWTIELETSLLNMYAKCGCLQEARQLFDKMRKQGNKNVITWNAMIAGYAQFGNAQEALDLFDEMKLENMKPNDITFINLLT